jgi:hypothetical protein
LNDIVTFPGATPEWASYMGYEVRGTFTDRSRRYRYDLDGNEVTDDDRIVWTPPAVPFADVLERG